MQIVTSGQPFLDIDGYASCIALAELLRLQGKEAIACSSARFNAGITATVQAWGGELKVDYTPTANDTFIVVDVSEPEYFDAMVDLERVVEVIDHRPGFEAYWQNKIGKSADIDFVGAACTIVFERWQNAGLLDQMSKTSARVLICGILDNTLNLGAKITTQRDTLALSKLTQLAQLPHNWPEHYFTECQTSMLSNLQQSIVDDSKVMQFPSQQHKTNIGQLALWDAQDFIQSHKNTLQEVLAAKQIPWFMNLIDIRSGKSVFVCQDLDLKPWLAELLGITFVDDVATADRMWLRKEIMKQALDATQQTQAA